MKVSRKIKGCFEGVLRMFQGNFEGVLIKFQVCFMKVSKKKKFQRCFKGVSGV